VLVCAKTQEHLLLAVACFEICFEMIAGPNEFQEFYKRLKEIKDFHRKHPDQVFVPMSVEFDELEKMRENPTDELNSK